MSPANETAFKQPLQLSNCFPSSERKKENHSCALFNSIPPLQ